MDKVLVFIPMYNCEKQIVRVLNQLKGEIANYITETIIVNNRSTDNGEQAAVDKLKAEKFSFPIKLLRNKQNYGLGGSHKVAFNYALKNEFDYIVVLHGDDQGSIRDFLPVLKSKKYENYDAILGSRFMKQSKTPGYSWFRIIGNHVFNIIFSVLTGRRIMDLGAGLNLYKVKILKDQRFLKFSDDLTFNCYSLLDICDKSKQFRFYPIVWKEEDQVSNAKLYSQSIKTLKIIFSYFINRKKFFERVHTANQQYEYDIIAEV